jgi:hypothetical protein
LGQVLALSAPERMQIRDRHQRSQLEVREYEGRRPFGRTGPFGPFFNRPGRLMVMPEKA